MALKSEKMKMEDSTMQKISNGILLKILTVLTLLAMLTVNALANILPLNGIGTGAVSDSYPNLFAPTGLTFAIWGVIYLLLALYTLYQIGLFRDKRAPADTGLLARVGVAFSISSLANTVWIFSWHYRIILLSMVLMLVILGCLIYIAQVIRKETLSARESFFIKIPFGVYFGWITVATIANATTLLVDLDWNRFGLSEPLWTICILVVGMLIGSVTTIRNRDIAYGLVLVWAYAGILIKHTAAAGFAGEYGQVISAVIVCIVLLTAALAVAAIQRIRQPKIPA
jgi:hypothetical protein